MIRDIYEKYTSTDLDWIFGLCHCGNWIFINVGFYKWPKIKLYWI